MKHDIVLIRLKNLFAFYFFCFLINNNLKNNLLLFFKFLIEIIFIHVFMKFVLMLGLKYLMLNCII
jgi:hypothetical protein